MNKPHQPNTHVPTRASRPPAPSPVDIQIGRNNGSSVPLEATRERMVSSKRMTPTPFQRIEQLNRENGRLREEVAYHQKLESVGSYFTKEAKDALEILQQAVFELRRAQKEIREEFTQDTSEYSTETARIQIGINELR
jgi:hypothetical protein